MSDRFRIPKHCYVRWQAALAVLEDLEEDVDAPFDMGSFADDFTLWERTNGCGSAACFAGYISVAPYCRALDYPEGDTGNGAEAWLLGVRGGWINRTQECRDLYWQLFHERNDQGSRPDTLGYLKEKLKRLFHQSTGKRLTAPLTFYVEEAS